MAKDKQFEIEYKAEGKRRIKNRKVNRLSKLKNKKPRIGTERYEREVAKGNIQTCEWGNTRCDLYGCNGDC